jgi:hypothetical protein
MLADAQAHQTGRRMSRRPRRTKRVIGVLAAVVAAFLGTTWWALESGGVAVLETRAPGGGLRSTHVWYAEPNGELWLEAGTPENAWFEDVRRDPTLRFRAEGRSGRYLAQPLEEPGAHARIRSLLRRKYGLRDRWVGLLVDTSRSVAVRLVPVPPGGGG